MNSRFTTPQNASSGKNGQRFVGLVLGLIVLLVGCARTDVPAVELPSTSIIDTRPTWAVITVPYLRLRGGPSSDEAVVSHLRRGDIARIIAIDARVVNLQGVVGRWYHLVAGDAEGWALNTTLEALNSEARAQNVAARLLEE